MPHLIATFPRSGVLVLGEHAVHSLVPSTLISQAESLLESHRIQDAIDLAEQQRKKIYSNLTVNDDEIEELQYVYQRIGFQCFSETLFEDAGNSFFEGNLDPRLLVSYYPELCGSLFSADDALNVYAGVEARMPHDVSVDDLIRNYSPHLSTRSAPPTAELRKILGMAAQEMLEIFLKKCRQRRKIDSAQHQDSFAVVDTVLAKLFAQLEKTKELYALLLEANNIVISELEPVLKTTGQYNALCMIYRQTKEDAKLLETWAKLVEGEWTDEDISDPLSDMITLLTEKKDRVLMQHWAIWLTKIDPDRGLKLLTSFAPSKRREKTDDDSALLKQISETNPIAGLQYLEHLVLQRRGSTEELHEKFARALVDQLVLHAADDSIAKLWRAKAASYASSRTESTSSFFSYFMSTTPDSDHKRVRIKTILFLQGSTLYNVQNIQGRLQPHSKLLKIEMAILEGKLKNHRDALSILIHDMHDSTSAEVYCTLGGDVIPGKAATLAAESVTGLQPWITAPFFPRPTGNVDDLLKKGLLKILLEVFLAEQSSSSRAARLLDSQAVNMDVADVLPVLPSEWPVSLTSPFLARSFRRTIHCRHEGQILRAVSAAQNLEVKEKAWLILREEGMIIEDALDTDDDDEDGEIVDEKSALQVTLGPEVFVEEPERRHWDNIG